MFTTWSKFPILYRRIRKVGHAQYRSFPAGRVPRSSGCFVQMTWGMSESFIMKRRRNPNMFKCILLLVFVLAGGSASVIRCDTLFRERNPVKIGHGSQTGSAIEWTDCAGNKHETFDSPPYSLDQADNCKVNPRTFGLDCAGDSCTVVDEKAARKYLPGVTHGDSVNLHVESDSVELRSHENVVRIER